ncbi:MAG: phosphomannomutase/phosphoglucomutase [Candidatus Liptonbacteria bacterium]|nr:phosphomannomutase/phosphoglucomutase [Candidatus Liptonbacteria bacterium]
MMDAPKINQSIFKTYDVRGIYPTEINGEVAEVIGKALGTMFGKGPVAVGRDMRIGSEELFLGLVKGLIGVGTDVHDLGLVPVDGVYFAVHKLNYAGAIMITASHNPKEYNGMKIAKRAPVLKLRQPQGLKESKFSTGFRMEWVWGGDAARLVQQPFNIPESPGSVVPYDLWPAFLDHLFSFVEVSKVKPLKVVVDAGNGLAGKVVPLLAPRLPIKVIPLFFELDGNFPNHPSNPLMPESQIVIRDKVLETGADFGVIFDGDTDRLFFVDEKGNFIRADITLLLLAKLMLEREPGAAVVYNVICSKMVREQVMMWGGRPIRAPVGYANITKAMRETNAIVSGELSSHYAFRDNGYADSGFIAFLILLELISQSGEPLSEMVRPFQKYYKGDEVNFPLQEMPSDKVIEAVAEKYKDGKQDRLDGLTVEYPDWWLNVRPSNTEPLLRVTMEANTREIFEAKKAEILGFIQLLCV